MQGNAFNGVECALQPPLHALVLVKVLITCTHTISAGILGIKHRCGLRRQDTVETAHSHLAMVCSHGDKQDARSIHGVTGELVFKVLGPMGLGEAAMYLRHSSDMAAFATGVFSIYRRTTKY